MLRRRLAFNQHGFVSTAGAGTVSRSLSIAAIRSRAPPLSLVRHTAPAGTIGSFASAVRHCSATSDDTAATASSETDEEKEIREGLVLLESALVSHLFQQAKPYTPAKVRDLTRALPDDALDVLEHMPLKDAIARFPRSFRLKQLPDTTWIVQLRPQTPTLLRDLQAAVPHDRWLPFKDVYVSLTEEAKDELRTSQKSLKGAVGLMDDCFRLSAEGLHVCQLDEKGEPSPKLPTDPDVASSGPMPDSVLKSTARPPPKASGVFRNSGRTHESRLQEEETQQLMQRHMVRPAVAGEIEHDLPPPPPPSGVSSATDYRSRVGQLTPHHVQHGGANTDVPAHALHVSMLTQYVPSYFVPAEVVLADMPGYSLEHLEELFVTARGFQVVRIQGQPFMRLHGYFGYWDMAAVSGPNQKYREFELPTRDMLEIFGKAFPKPGTWHPLRTVIARIEEDDAYKKLPFKGPFTLLYFAQHQHLFAFSADNGGAVAAVQNVKHLGPDTSPCALTVNQLFRVTKSTFIDLTSIETLLPEEATAQMYRCFDDWNAFMTAHSQFFAVVGGTIGQVRDLERLKVRDAPLEQQLEFAYQRGLFQKVRALRRKIRIQMNPDNPLLESENLAKAIVEYLPPNRSVKLQRLLYDMPREITDLFPREYRKFFRRFPEHFQVFEYRYANNNHIMRAGLPLPDGVVRGTYDEISVLACIVRLLQLRNPQDTYSLASRLPDGARNMVKTTYNGLHHLLAQYPENFVIVGQHNGDRNERYRVTLVSVPSKLVAAVDPTAAPDDSAAPSDARGNIWEGDE